MRNLPWWNLDRLVVSQGGGPTNRGLLDFPWRRCLKWIDPTVRLIVWDWSPLGRAFDFNHRGSCELSIAEISIWLLCSKVRHVRYWNSILDHHWRFHLSGYDRFLLLRRWFGIDQLLVILLLLDCCSLTCKFCLLRILLFLCCRCLLLPQCYCSHIQLLGSDLWLLLDWFGSGDRYLSRNCLRISRQWVAEVGCLFLHDGFVEQILDTGSFLIVFAEAEIHHSRELLRVRSRNGVILASHDLQNQSTLIVRFKRMLQRA